MIYTNEAIAKRIEELGAEVVSLKAELNKSYQQGRADAVDRFLEEYLTLPITLGVNDCNAIMKRVAEQIKEQKNESN